MRNGSSWENLESYPCRGWCGVGTPQPKHDQRRAFRCALPGFEESWWDDGSAGKRLYMGRLPIHGELDPLELEQDDPLLPKDDHRDGCPGAWYRSAFASSLHKYERHLTDGGFSANPLLDRCQDRLVLEAIQFLEAERLRARAHWLGVRQAAERK